MRFTIAARICDRLEAMLAPAGITARRPNMVGASSYVSTFLGRHGREGAIRISALPFDALRFELHEDYAWHGWTGERRIADIAGPPDDAPFVASPNLIAQILAYFGSDPDQRDVMIATAGRAERHARAGATRRGRRVAAERALAEHTLDRAERDPHHASAILERALVSAPSNAARARTRALIARHAAERGMWEVIALLRQCGWSDKEIASGVQTAVSTNLDALVSARPYCGGDDLRAALWKTLAGAPLETRLAQSDLLTSWVKAAPASDLLSAAVHDHLVTPHLLLPMDKAAVRLAPDDADTAVIDRDTLAATAVAVGRHSAWAAATGMQANIHSTFGHHPAWCADDALDPFPSHAAVLAAADHVRHHDERAAGRPGIADLFTGLSDLDRTIFIAMGTNSSSWRMARCTGLTENEVQRAHGNASRHVAAQLATPAFTPLQLRIAALRAGIGAAAPIDSPIVRRLIDHATNGSGDVDIRDAAITVAGPFEMRLGWLLRDDSPPAPDSTFLNALANEWDIIPIDTVRRALVRRGVCRAFVDDWISHEPRWQRVADAIMPTFGYPEVLSASVIAAHGEPMHTNDLLRIIRYHGDADSFDFAMHGSPWLICVAPDTWALAP